MNNKTILVNHRLFNGIDNHLHENKSIVIDNGKISAIEDRIEKPLISEYTIIDLKGLTLLPGLIDNHVHLSLPFVHTGNIKVILESKRQIRKNLKYCINSGVTTVRDAGAVPGWIDYCKSIVKHDITAGPRILTTNSTITAENGCPDWVQYFTHFQKIMARGEYKESPKTPADAKKLVKKMIDKGADWIKIYYQSKSWSIKGHKLPVFDNATFRAIMDTAGEYGKKVCCHVVFLDDLKSAIPMGINSTEHSIIDSEIPDSIIDDFIQRGIAIHPTLTYLDLMGNKELKRHFYDIVCKKGDVFLEPESLRQVKQYYDLHLSESYPPINGKSPYKFYDDVALFNQGYPIALKNLLKLQKAGAKVGVGSDSGGSCMSYFGILYPEELKRMTSAGLTNYEVLKAATSVNAEIIGMSDRIGSISKGRIADLVAVEGNPLIDIDVMKNIKMIFKEGKEIKTGGNI